VALQGAPALLSTHGVSGFLQQHAGRERGEQCFLKTTLFPSFFFFYYYLFFIQNWVTKSYKFK
jgi:hypothetical protein